MHKLSVVVPCFNEAECLAELHRRVTAVCEDLVPGGYELILVNDGSRDSTWPTIESLVSADERIVGVNLSRNHGHQLALTAGLCMAQGERIFVLDADLQDPPELLPKMMAQMDDGYDVVYGQRVRRHGDNMFKKSSAALFYRILMRLSDTPIPPDSGDFRLISRRALDALLAMPEQHRFVRGMVSWIGFAQTALSYDREERFAGATSYPIRKMMRFAFDAITGFSIQPLRFASQIGVALGGLGALLVAYILIAWLSGDTVRGWTSLMAVVLVLGSVQMVVLGVMGEYLGRLYMQAKNRPLFLIQDIACRGRVDISNAERLGYVAATQAPGSETEDPFKAGATGQQAEAPSERRGRAGG
ncbi:MAG: glycosyltransferase family 2 protein [Alphaproteobacteria bacterium]|nr:glycosyltransferase family 2 protein [Alphaproteobacteria bacterium]